MFETKNLKKNPDKGNILILRIFTKVDMVLYVINYWKLAMSFIYSNKKHFFGEPILKDEIFLKNTNFSWSFFVMKNYLPPDLK